MMSTGSFSNSNSVRTQLLNAALDFFLNDDYHKVTTRAIAERANTNVAMIRYYFGHKEGLYEEMIRETIGGLLDVLDGDLLSSTEGFRGYFRLYYKTMQQHPAFPKLILKVLALNQGPGRKFLFQLLERGRTGSQKKLKEAQSSGSIKFVVDPDIIRMAFVSLAITPLLLKDIFEEQLEYEMDVAFFNNLAEFNGHLFHAGLSTTPESVPIHNKDA